MARSGSNPTQITTTGSGGGLTDAELRATPVETDPVDDYATFEAQHVTLVASTDTTITFTTAGRCLRIKNWDTANRVLVKDGAITSDTDATASRVGKAPQSDLPNSEFYPFATTTVHLRSAATNEVTVENYIGSV